MHCLPMQQRQFPCPDACRVDDMTSNAYNGCKYYFRQNVMCLLSEIHDPHARAAVNLGNTHMSGWFATWPAVTLHCAA